MNPELYDHSTVVEKKEYDKKGKQNMEAIVNMTVEAKKQNTSYGKLEGANYLEQMSKEMKAKRDELKAKWGCAK